MRKSRAIFLLAAGLICILFFILSFLIGRYTAYRFPYEYDERFLGIAVVENKDIINGKTRKESAMNPGVCFEGVPLPYDESGRLYLSQQPAGEWVGRLSASEEGYYVCVLRDEFLDRTNEAVSTGHEFELLLFDDGTYYEFKLVISGMPVISITTEYEEEPVEVDYFEDPDTWTFESFMKYYGQISVFDPRNTDESYEITQSRLSYSEKGMLTRYYPKRSYKFKLMDHKGNDVETSLLGMNSQSAWKLNAMMGDQNRLREMTAWQIWDKFDETNPVNESGAHMEYAELIIDNKYLGIYALVESVTAEKLGVDRNDILYKSVGEVVPSEDEMQQAVDEEWKYQVSFRIRRPKIISDYAVAWYPMTDFLNSFYRDRPIDYKSAVEKVELSNFMDNYLFLMATSACDNNLKNTYYYAKVTDPQKYRMYRIPWDLDYTFGNYFSLDGDYNTTFNPDYTVNGTVAYSDINYLDYGENVFLQLLEAAPDEVYSLLQSRWTECRQSFLSNAAVEKLILDNRDYLVNTGAIIREQQAWPQCTVSTDIDYLIEYQKSRLDWLDDFLK